MASQSLKEASTHQNAPAHQAASVLSPLGNVPASSSASLPSYFSNNFSGNPFWLPPNLSHSIFSVQYVDRQAYKPQDWIIDTGATDHMVHSVSCLTTITSTINTYVYLPNGERALVTHIGIVHISETLVLYGVLCVPSFTFNLISVN